MDVTEKRINAFLAQGNNSEQYKLISGVGAVEWLGVTPFFSNISIPQEKLTFSLKGIRGDKYEGLRVLDAREVLPLSLSMSKGQMIRNDRQVTILSLEELGYCCELLGVLNHPKTPPKKNIPPELLGGNIIISGIEELSKLHYGSRFIFFRGPKTRNVILDATGENHACAHPSKQLDIYYNEGVTEAPIDFSKFPGIANDNHLRGITASIFSTGKISTGDKCYVLERQF